MPAACTYDYNSNSLEGIEENIVYDPVANYNTSLKDISVQRQEVD